MANEMTPVVWDDETKKHRPLGTGEKMGGLDASSIISSDSGNLLEAGSDGLAYVSGSGVVDPRADNLLEESDRGKLQVTVDRIAEWLDGHPQDAALLADAINAVSGDEGNLIVQGSDKGAFLSNAELAAAFAGLSDAEKQAIAAAVAEKMAAQLADGKTIVASGGKLTADPSNATPAQKKKINEALADASSGLVVDNSTGKLGVDFSQMPTDKFEALLAGLRMQVPLSANLSLHVDGQSAAAGDDIVDGRGTAARPFKTVQACVTWATGYYSLGRYNVSILIHPGTYDETVRLPTYNASGGVFSLRASDYANPPVLRRATSTAEANIAVDGGLWKLYRLSVVNRPLDSGGARNLYGYCLAVGEGAIAHIYGCEFDMSYGGGATSRVRIYMLSVSGGMAAFYPLDSYASKLTYHAGDAAHFAVLNASDSGKLQFAGSFDSNNLHAIECSGDAEIFAQAANQGLISTVGGGTYRMYCVAASGATCTGKRYEATENSGIVAPGGHAFPGDASGSVEAETYSWYKE